MKKASGSLAVALVALAASAQWSNSAEDVPAYNALPATRALPAILSGKQLTGMYFQQPYKVIVYKIAAKIPAVLHQQPCYCHCDRAMGHNSLHSCFEGTHGAQCETCMKEAVYSYEATKKGKTPAQIRTGIERGEWASIDLEHARM